MAFGEREWQAQLKQLLLRIRLNVRLGGGRSVFNEVVYGVKKALLSGEFQPGQYFPSVRALAKELKIHRNTAHQIVKYLAEKGWLETCPGALTEITNVRGAPAGERLTELVDQLVVEARRLGWDLADVVQAVEERGRSRGGLKCRRDRSTRRRDANLPGVAGSQVTEITGVPASSLLQSDPGP